MQDTSCMIIKQSLRGGFNTRLLFSLHEFAREFKQNHGQDPPESHIRETYHIIMLKIEEDSMGAEDPRA